jgi:hypothetical protein
MGSWSHFPAAAGDRVHKRLGADGRRPAIREPDTGHKGEGEGTTGTTVAVALLSSWKRCISASSVHSGMG